MDGGLDLHHLIRIVWQRRWYFLVPAVLAMVLAVALIAVLTPIYRSEATVLIEERELPEDLVSSVITDYVDRRIEMLSRRVLIDRNLVEIAERFDLYPDARREMTLTDLVAQVRDAIDINVLTTEINDPSTGRSGEATIAFQVSFTYPDPTIAQKVTSELVSWYLSTNLADRRETATENADFFRNEREEIEKRIANLEEELAVFKTENQLFLPEEVVFNRGRLADIESALRQADRELQVLHERESFLSTQLTLTPEFESSFAGAGPTPETQLELLRAELATARAQYSVVHPDVVRLERQVRSLGAMVGSRSGSAALIAEENRLAAELGALRERYTSQHPDVQGLERKLASVRASIQQNGAGASSGPARSPAYVQLSAQLNGVQSEINAVEEQRRELREELSELEELLVRAPSVERDYDRLNRLLDNALIAREDLANKEVTAQLGRALETQSMSERFTLVEPPSVPTEPTSPNKKLILALGLLLAVGSGTASTALAEILDHSVRGTRDLARLLGDQPLVSIPTIVTAADRRRARWRLGAIVATAVLLVAGGLFWVQQNVAPLDVLGFQLRAWIENFLDLSAAS